MRDDKSVYRPDPIAVFIGLLVTVVVLILGLGLVFAVRGYL